MSNCTVPAAAEGLPDIDDLETIVHELTLAVRLCDSMVQGALYPLRKISNDDGVTVDGGSRQLVAYAATHAHDLADKLRKDFYAAINRQPQAAAADPCLAFLNDWSQAVEDSNRLKDEAHWHAVVEPLDIAARDGKIPAPTTAEGAAAALRKIIEFDDVEGQDRSLVLAALAYLEGVTA